MQRRAPVVAAALCVAAPPIILAQDYPAKPVRLYVGFVPGSGTDTAARLLAQRLDELTKQPFVVENRPGAGGNLAAETVAKAPADGYTLLLAAAALAIQPAMTLKLPFEAETHTPEQFAEFVKKEVEQNIELARNAGIRRQ